MREKTIFQIGALYRDDFRVRAFLFGSGEKSCCFVGATRGNEYQQMYLASRLVHTLQALEAEGRICDGKSILVLPCVNPYSVNIKKRFWGIDDTDINRMFPGYDRGETTQRIAAAVFQVISTYRIGIQFASFYMPGRFVPHVRITKTGREETSLACTFGFPYVLLHEPRPFDTTTLNYNWQIWDTDAFSIYTTSTSAIDHESAAKAEEAILRFLGGQGIIRYQSQNKTTSLVVGSSDLACIRSSRAGFFFPAVQAGDFVKKGQIVATIQDVYTAEKKEVLQSPADGLIIFSRDDAITYQNAAIFKLIPDLNPGG